MLVFDIETDGLLNTVSMVHCINLIDRSTGREYRFNDHEFYLDTDGSVTDVPTNRDGTIDAGLVMLTEAQDLAGLNITGYDIPALKKLYPGFEPKGLLWDTKIASKLLFPELKDRDFASIRKNKLDESFMKQGLCGSHSLKAWGIRVGTQLKDDFNPKDYGHTWATMPFTKIFDDYCMQDIRTNVAVQEAFEAIPSYNVEVLEIENRCAMLAAEQEMNGVHFDSDDAERLVGKLMPRRAEIEMECLKVFHPWYTADGPYNRDPKSGVGNRGLFIPKRDNKSQGYHAGVPLTKIKQVVFNPASRDQIANRLHAIYDWHPLEMTEGGKPKVDETILSALPYPEAKILAEFFTLNKRLGQIAEGKEAWLKKVTPEGKIHGRVDTLGAITNRMTHMGPNLAQVPANHAPYGEECRSLFGPRPHWKQVGCDADGLEGRCLGHYLYRWDNGAFVKTILEGNKDDGTDLHSMNRDSVGLNERDAAKTIFYGWMYGAGDYKLGTIYIDDRTDEQKQKFYKAFPAGKKRDSAIVKLGKRSRSRLVAGISGMDELLEKVKLRSKSGWLRAIDGRRLRVRSQHSALNTLLQGAGAIAMKHVWVIADRVLRETVGSDNFAWMLNIHDELQLECHPSVADQCGQIMADAIITAGNDLSFNCPLTGSYKVGDSWSETH